MPYQRAGESNPPHPQASHLTVSVKLLDEDLRGLDALAKAAGVGRGDSESVAQLPTSTLHRGVIESYSSAGLTWPPPRAGGDIDGLGAFGTVAAEQPSANPLRSLGVRKAAVAIACLATVVVIIGSYAGHWTWTGLQKNGQVWDWLQLLLLPVALGTFPLWLQFSGEMSVTRRRVLGGVVIAFVAFAVIGYLVPLTWTGFRGHTLWSWLTLIVLPVTITTATVWPKTGRKFRATYRTAAEILAAAWVVTLIGGYAAHWSWTGYPGNTLWDWAQLLLAPVALTTFVVPELIRVVSGGVGPGGGSPQDPA